MCFTSSGIPHGHTGHVRFLTCVEKPVTSQPAASKNEIRAKNKRHSAKPEKNQRSDPTTGKLLVISGGDGYEDFRGPQASIELQAGREDSTNHLLLWKIWKMPQKWFGYFNEPWKTSSFVAHRRLARRRKKGLTAAGRSIDRRSRSGDRRHEVSAVPDLRET